MDFHVVWHLNTLQSSIQATFSVLQISINTFLHFIAHTLSILKIRQLNNKPQNMQKASLV